MSVKARFAPALAVVVLLTLAGQATAVPGTPNDEDVLEARRMRAQPAIAEIVDAIERHPTEFGGVLLDDEVGGLVITVVLVRGRASARSLLPSTPLPEGVSVEFAEGEHSLASLRATQQTLIARFNGDSRLVGVGLDIDRGLVELDLSSIDSTTASDLRSDYGSAVQVRLRQPLVDVACNNRYSCTPWRGGIYLYPLDLNGEQCTYAFTAKSGSQYYFLTAGHCDNETWVHDDYVIGTTNLNNLLTQNVASGDFQRVPRGSLTTPRNRVYLSDLTKSYSIIGVRAHNYQLQGDTVRLTGYVSGSLVGKIRDVSYWGCIAFRGTQKCFWLKQVRDALVTEGDSGGPAYYSSSAYGIICCKDDIYSYYSTADRAEWALGVTICQSDGC